MLNTLLSRLPKIRGTYRESADLSKVNWFNVGGPAEILFRPLDTEDLADFLAQKPKDVVFTVIGVGSNLLVRDGGIDGVVIRLGRGFAQITREGGEIIAGAAALDFNVAHYAAHCGISGLEFLVGIPGTIGGALAMNAGAYGADIASILVEATALDESGALHKLAPEDIGYIYRGNTLPDGMVFTEARFRGTPGDKAAITKRMQEISNNRESTQPVKSRTSGSTFKNPQGHKAWELIDQVGGRGLVIGGAQVSEKHCNFLINTGDATAEDIEHLGEELRKRVAEKTGIQLTWEIQIIGHKN